MITPVTSESAWRLRLEGLPHWQPPQVPTLVIAPHPDDETLGAGGLIARLRSQGTEVTVVAVTDGENAYPDTPGLGQVREREQNEALARLDVGRSQIHRLRLTDSDVSSRESELVDCLLALLPDGTSPDRTHIVAPWPRDFHPDHESCGRAAKAAAVLKNARLTSYFFWTWHRARTELLDGLPLTSLPLGEKERQAKRQALLCHRSQLEHVSGHPILARDLLQPAYRGFEVYLPS